MWHEEKISVQRFGWQSACRLNCMLPIWIAIFPFYNISNWISYICLAHATISKSSDFVFTARFCSFWQLPVFWLLQLQSHTSTLRMQGHHWRTTHTVHTQHLHTVFIHRSTHHIRWDILAMVNEMSCLWFIFYCDYITSTCWPVLFIFSFIQLLIYFIIIFSLW